MIARHLLPATRGFLAVQATVLVPAFIMAEATLSFVGLGFAAPTPSWGVMLLDAAAVRVVADAPWLLAPAAAIVAHGFGGPQCASASAIRSFGSTILLKSL